MKKYLLYMLTAMLMGMTAGTMSSCNGCGKGEPSSPTVDNKTDAITGDYDGVTVDFTAGVDHIVALHRQTMFQLYGGEQYAWYETRVLFNDSLKWETIGGLKVTDVTDIFQVFEPMRCQFISSSIEKGTIIAPPIADIWIEDCDMSEAPVKLWPEDVLALLQRWDGILPPAVGMTLRIPLGPRKCNAQWVIGNIFDVIFVDAVTGEITNWCPAFPIPNVAGPLGEWP